MSPPVANAGVPTTVTLRSTLTSSAFSGFGAAYSAPAVKLFVMRKTCAVRGSTSSVSASCGPSSKGRRYDVAATACAAPGGHPRPSVEGPTAGSSTRCTAISSRVASLSPMSPSHSERRAPVPCPPSRSHPGRGEDADRAAVGVDGEEARRVAAVVMREDDIVTSGGRRDPARLGDLRVAEREERGRRGGRARGQDGDGKQHQRRKE